MSKLLAQYYVFLDKERMQYFDGGKNLKNVWEDNLEYCYVEQNIKKAREINEKIKILYGVECSIIEVNLREIK